MAKTNCLVCSKNNFELFCKQGEYDLVKCINCSFIFVCPLPQAKIINKLYHNFDYRLPEIVEKVIRRDARRSLSKIRTYINHFKFRELLDIGCGRGYFLDEARRDGWNTTGIDYSQKIIYYASNVLHLNVKKADIYKYRSSKKFSIISLSQVIEHVIDPRKLLRHCNNLLENDGYLYIATPNIESLSSKVFRESFEHIIPPEHISYFSKNTLSRLLTNCGYKIVYIGSWSYPGDLAGIIKKKLGLHHTQRIESTLNNEKNITQVFSMVQHLKSIIFDKLFCGIFYKLLELNTRGTILEVIAQKK